MALRAFLGERRFVLHTGRRFTVSPPSVRTVAAALSVYGAEIVGCRLAYLKRPDLYAHGPLEACLPLFSDGPRTSYVLATCCQLHGGAPGELEELVAADPKLARSLIEAATDLCDLGRIIVDLDLDGIATAQERNGPAPGLPGQEGPSAMELICTGLAEHFRIDPMAVWGWPFEAVIALSRRIIPSLHPGQPGEEIFGMTEAEWAAEGVRITKPTEH